MGEKSPPLPTPPPPSIFPGFVGSAADRSIEPPGFAPRCVARSYRSPVRRRAAPSVALAIQGLVRRDKAVSRAKAATSGLGAALVGSAPDQASEVPRISTIRVEA